MPEIENQGTFLGRVDIPLLTQKPIQIGLNEIVPGTAKNNKGQSVVAQYDFFALYLRKGNCLLDLLEK